MLFIKNNFLYLCVIHRENMFVPLKWLFSWLPCTHFHTCHEMGEFNMYSIETDKMTTFVYLPYFKDY
jgi:hypothetical protein